MPSNIGVRGTVLLLLASLTFSLLAQIEKAHAAEDFAALRAHWVDQVTGGTAYDPEDSLLAPKISAITIAAQTHWDDLNKEVNRTYLWEDLDTSPPSAKDITTSYQRLYEMTLAYKTIGSALESDGSLLSDIISALDWLYSNRYNENVVVTSLGDWWDFEIGSPKHLANIVVLLYPHLLSGQISDYMNVVGHFTADPTILHETTPAEAKLSTGPNLVGQALIVALRAIVLEDAQLLAEARDSLSHPQTSIFEYGLTKDGFYEDGSFIYHEYFPYNGGYGKSLLARLTDLMHLLAASAEHNVTDPARSNMYQWVYDAFEPVMYSGGMMSMVSGREISRDYLQEHVSGHYLIGAIVKMAQFADLDSRPQDAAAYRSMVKGWIERDTYADFFEAGSTSIPVAIEADDILNDLGVNPRTEPTGYFHFPSMDRALLRRPGFAFGIAMHSARVQNYEQIAGENLRGWHTADGMTYLYDDDLAQYSEDFWPTVDANRLSGTTVTQDSTSTTRRFNDAHWVGGAEILESYGIAGMLMRPYGQDLSAKKSWFMFDDEIVALGGEIVGGEALPVETIVDNRRLNGAGTNELVVDGNTKPTTLPWQDTMSGVSWAHLAGNVSGSDIGYYFPGTSTIDGLREERTGSWHDINDRPVTPTDPRTNNYLTLWVDHGSSPQGASYSYVLLPGRSAAQTDTYASSPDVAIVENSSRAHAVKEQNNGLLGVNFWTDSVESVDMVTVNRRASVMIHETVNDIEIALSDPTQLNEGTIDVEIARSATDLISADSEVTVLQYHPTIKLRIDVSGARGRSFNAKFDLTGSPAANPPPPPDSDTEPVVIVDNTDPGFASETIWPTSTGAPGYHGSDYTHDGSSQANPLKWSRWTPYLGASGTYEVFMRWTSHANRADAAPVEITHSGGTSATTVNQQLNGGAWVSLGSYDLDAGTSNSVKVSASDDGYTVADAVKFVRTYRYELESTPRSTSGPADSNHVDGAASAGAWNKLNANAVGDYIDYEIEVPESGSYSIRLRSKVHPSRGMFRLYLPGPGIYVGDEQDQYDATIGYTMYDLGSHEFSTPGVETFRLVVSGKHASSTGFTLGSDFIELVAE